MNNSPPSAVGADPVEPAAPAGRVEPVRDAVFTPLTPHDPHSVSRYLLRARIGEGGMGAVYLSYTPGGRPIALKVARPELAADPDFRSRFAKEVAIARRVQGPYTVPVIDADAEALRPWIATAYVAAPSLAVAVVRQGALPSATVLMLIAGVAEALQSIHRAGVIHRDLKPGNVILADDGPRVIDFGVARAVETSTAAMTQTGVRIGTPAFMSPEQVRGKQIDAAGDVFALGSTAYYALTGRPPFGSDAAVFHRIEHQQPDWDHCPDNVRQVLARCLEKDPADRPTSTQVIELCRLAITDDLYLQSGGGWLPPTVAAEVTRYRISTVPAPAMSMPPSVPPPTFQSAPTGAPDALDALGTPSVPSIPSGPRVPAASRLPAIQGAAGPYGASRLPGPAGTAGLSGAAGLPGAAGLSASAGATGSAGAGGAGGGAPRAIGASTATRTPPMPDTPHLPSAPSLPSGPGGQGRSNGHGVPGGQGSASNGRRPSDRRGGTGAGAGPAGSGASGSGAGVHGAGGSGAGRGLGAGGVRGAGGVPGQAGPRFGSHLDAGGPSTLGTPMPEVLDAVDAPDSPEGYVREGYVREGAPEVGSTPGSPSPSGSASSPSSSSSASSASSPGFAGPSSSAGSSGRPGASDSSAASDPSGASGGSGPRSASAPARSAPPSSPSSPSLDQGGPSASGPDAPPSDAGSDTPRPRRRRRRLLVSLAVTVLLIVGLLLAWMSAAKPLGAGEPAALVVPPASTSGSDDPTGGTGSPEDGADGSRSAGSAPASPSTAPNPAHRSTSRPALTTARPTPRPQSVGCPARPVTSANGDGSAVLDTASIMREGPAGACDSVATLARGRKFWLWCSVVNKADEQWWWARLDGTETYGWVLGNDVTISYADDNEDGRVQVYGCDGTLTGQ